MEFKEGSIVTPLPTSEDLNRKEGMWNIKLPSDYKEFICKYNGIISDKSTFICNKHKYAIDRFLCILNKTDEHEHGDYDVDVVLTQIEERLTSSEDLVGVERLPIAMLFAGDYICLDFKNNQESPTICLWSHEESGYFEPTLYFVASTFSEFIEMLTE